MKVVLVLLLSLVILGCKVQAQSGLSWQQSCSALETTGGWATTCTGVIPPLSGAAPAPTPTPMPPSMSVVALTGLVADGTTDNCQALTDLAKQGVPVRLPSGVILFSCPIDFNAFVDQGREVKDIIWQGNGPFSTTLKYTGPGVGVTVGRLAPFYGPSLYWRDFSYIGTDTGQTGLALHSLTVPGPVLENVRLRSWGTAVTTLNVYNLEIRNSVIQANTVGLRLGAVTTASTIQRTEFAGNSTGIWLAGIGIQNIHILDNAFEVNQQAILSNGGEFITIEGNYFTANKDNFVHVGYNPVSCPGCGLLSGAYLLRNYGVSAKFGDSVRLAVVEDNAADDTAAYSIRNEYTENAGQTRRIYVKRNWSAFGTPGYEPYTRYDGTQAQEFIRLP